MIDTHAHLDKKAFGNGRDDAILRFFYDDGKALIAIGVDPKSNKEAIALANENDNIFATVSIHPEEGDEIEPQKALKEIESQAKNDRVVAIGEIGAGLFLSQRQNSSTKRGIN